MQKSDKIRVNGVTVGADHRAAPSKNPDVIVGRLTFDLEDVLAKSVIDTFRSVFREKFGRDPTEAELRSFTDRKRVSREKFLRRHSLHS